MWTEKFQLYKLGFKEAEEPEFNLLTRVQFANICCIMKNARKFKEKKICFTDCVKVFDYVDPNKLWNILKEMGVPEHFMCLLRNVYVG